MAAAGVDVALIQFFTDVFYFAGSNQLSNLIVPLTGDPVLFVQVGADVARSESWIDDIRVLEGMQDIAAYLSEQGLRAAAIGITEDTISGILYRKYRENFPEARWINITPAILDIRSVKSAAEVMAIQQSAEVSCAGHRHVREVLAAGMTELDLSAQVEYAIRRRGHTGCSILRRNGYTLPAGPIAVSGPNLGVVSGAGAITMTGPGLTPALPMGASRRILAEGDLTVIDLSTNTNGYHSDEARMYVVGAPDDRQKRAYDILRAAYEAALAVIRPGAVGREVYGAARAVVEKAGYMDYFAGFSRYPQYNYLGHGVGLEAIEPPLINGRDETVLKPNMVIAIEPKLIAPHWGGSLEDTILVTETGCRVLTHSPLELTAV